MKIHKLTVDTRYINRGKKELLKLSIVAELETGINYDTNMLYADAIYEVEEGKIIENFNPELYFGVGTTTTYTKEIALVYEYLRGLKGETIKEIYKKVNNTMLNEIVEINAELLDLCI